ncbi:DUF3592 domain-containing protein [Luteolibacter sp. LG18]|uniref:DUF3592 domain-containing protein n=1 Tax=Luteolibacter sp. LG18 TaxID=2819286 RepID=UPI002B2ED5E5|nr:hypothetical protein llg_36190 [Luteolibacter sp. LG18]
MSAPSLDPSFEKAVRRIMRCFGIAVLCAPGIWLARTQWFISHAEPTVATIVALEKGGKGNSLYPVFEFDSPSGTVHRKRSSTACGSREFQVGDPVGVLYDPRDPTRSAIQSPAQIWSVPIITAIWFIGVGTFILRAAGKRRAPSSPTPKETTA